MSRTGIFLLALSLAVVACGGGDDADTPEAPSSPQATPTTVPAAPPAFSSGAVNAGTQEAFTFTSTSGVDVGYALYLPAGYDEATEWPLIISFHGFLGTDPSLDSVKRQNPAAWADPADLSFVVVAPRAASGLWSDLREPLEELLDVLSESLAINGDAVFLSGLSSGTPGVWQWALEEPERFVGIASVAGGTRLPGSTEAPDLCRLVDLPVWMAHGSDDDAVPLEGAREAAAELEACGSTVVAFTVYEGMRHHDAIARAYEGPELYDWMLEQIP